MSHELRATPPPNITASAAKPAARGGKKTLAILLAASGGAVAAALCPVALSKPPPAPPATICARNLKQLAASCIRHARDHGGILPPSLAVLAADRYAQRDTLFHCPARERTEECLASSPADAVESDYIYFGGGARIERLESETVLFAEKLGDHPGMLVNVAFGDGHVEGVALKGNAFRAVAAQKGWKFPVQAVP